MRWYLMACYVALAVMYLIVVLMAMVAWWFDCWFVGALFVVVGFVACEIARRMIDGGSGKGGSYA